MMNGEILKHLSSGIIPIIVILFLVCGLYSGINVFDVFITGAKDGLSSMIGILPNLIGLLAAVGVFKAAGGFDMMTAAVRPIAEIIGLLPETVPLAFLRPVSGSASLAFLTNLFSAFGPDSLIGRSASVMMGTTETILYTVAVYLGSVNITDSGYAIPVALTVDIASFILATYLCTVLF